MSAPVNRRGLLRALGLGAVGATGAIVGIGMAAPAAASAITPDLVAALESAVGTFRLAEERKAAARAFCDRALPTPPAEIVMIGDEDPYPHAHFYWHILADVDGRGAWPIGPKTVSVLTADSLDFQTSDIGCGPRTKVGRLIRRLMPIAEKFEAEREAVIQQSGYRDAAAACDQARLAVEKAAAAIMDIEPASQADVVHMARAMRAAGLVGRDGQLRAQILWGERLVDAIIAFGGVA